MLPYNDLSRFAAATIRADLSANNIPVTPMMEALLIALDTNPECWKGVFEGLNTWILTASSVEIASFWQSIIRVCNEDGRPYAAYPFLHIQQSKPQALLEMWRTLPSNALPALREALACNPIVHGTGLTGMHHEVAAASWAKVSAGMMKLSLHDVPRSEHQDMRKLVHDRVPHLSEAKKAELAAKAITILQEPRHKDRPKMHAAKMAIARSYRRPT